MTIKKNDNVVVRSGKDRGKKGKVLKVIPREGRVVVEGINLRRRRERPRRQGEKGQVIQVASPVATSTVAVWCGSCGRGARLGVKLAGLKKVRICRRCGKEL